MLFTWTQSQLVQDQVPWTGIFSLQIHQFLCSCLLLPGWKQISRCNGSFSPWPLSLCLPRHQVFSWKYGIWSDLCDQVTRVLSTYSKNADRKCNSWSCIPYSSQLLSYIWDKSWHWHWSTWHQLLKPSPASSTWFSVHICKDSGRQTDMWSKISFHRRILQFQCWASWSWCSCCNRFLCKIDNFCFTWSKINKSSSCIFSTRPTILRASELSQLFLSKLALHMNRPYIS